MILCDSDSPSDEEESSVEEESSLPAASAAGSALTTVSTTSEIGAPKSIAPVENYSIYLALIAASFSAADCVGVEEAAASLEESAEVSSSSSTTIS